MSTFSKTSRDTLKGFVVLEEVKRRTIVDALDRCGGNYVLAARSLDIGKTTIYRLAKTYKYSRKDPTNVWRES